mgnify:CR=1 FL=1
MREFDEKWPNLNDSTEDGGYDARIYVKSFIRTQTIALIEKIVEEVEAGRKNLVVDNWEDGQPKNCNPRCHDSGKDSALSDLSSHLRTEVAEAKDNK